MGQNEASLVAEAWWFWWLGLKSVVVGCWRWVVSVVGILGWVESVDGEVVVTV